MGEFDAEGFARAWVRDWNARDLEAVAGHFTEDAQFFSPRAEEVTGSPVVQGRDALRAYWQAGTGHLDRLQFTLDHVVWDGVERLAIVYKSEVGERRRRAVELLVIDVASGRARYGEAMYGAELRSTGMARPG
ncbi:MAG: nuclear transport factor 2 family protein [Dehalococcoidia bacterium]